MDADLLEGESSPRQMQETDGRPSRALGRLSVVLVAAGSTVLWILRPTAFIADDSYFYLVIARNLGMRGESTFSGVTDTNGFHPLWGYILSGYTAIVGRINEGWLTNPRYALPLAIALLGIAVVVWLRLADKLGLSPAIVAGIPVAYVGLFGTLYSEALVFLVLAGLIALRLADEADQSTRWWAVTGLLAGLVFLSRIDMMFFVAAALVILAWRHRPSPAQVAACAATGGTLVAAYLVFNTVTFGYPIPISGRLKSSFPELNLRGFGGSGLSTTIFGVNVVFGLLPFAVAAVALGMARRHRATPLLIAMFVGTFVQVLLIALFGHGPTSWYWYYVLSVAMAATSIAVVIESTRVEKLAPLALGFAAIAGISLGGFGNGEVPRQKAAVDLAESLDPDVEQTIIVSDWPGRVAFETDVNVFAADLLTTNYRFYDEMKASPNALEFVRERAAATGAPVTAVLYNGNQYLTADQTGVTLTDPAGFPDGAAIGRLDLGEPTDSNGGVMWWLLPPEG